MPRGGGESAMHRLAQQLNLLTAQTPAKATNKVRMHSLLLYLLMLVYPKTCDPVTKWQVPSFSWASAFAYAGQPWDEALVRTHQSLRLAHPSPVVSAFACAGQQREDGTVRAQAASGGGRGGARGGAWRHPWLGRRRGREARGARACRGGAPGTPGQAPPWAPAWSHGPPIRRRPAGPGSQSAPSCQVGHPRLVI